MLLIECPWCGPREETEFSCGGEAHIARPLDPDALSDEQWGYYLFIRKNPRGAQPGAVVSRAGMPAVVQRQARHPPRTRSRTCTRWARRPPEGKAREDMAPMSQICRLPAGGRIDRRTRLHFTFNGKRYEGHAGDTLASALLANGVHVVARSWKYHRPRGIVACGVEEPNAVVQLETGARAVPNARATEVMLYDGLVANSVNAWPSVDFDLMAVAGFFARIMPAGFYYKTFMWPKSFWRRYEHYIRKGAGLERRLPSPTLTATTR
jgi:sarcosine oxidase subunit alpha